MSVDDVEDMYRLLAIAKYEDRYVIPQAHAELAERLMEQQGTCGLDFEGGPGNCGAIGYDSDAETRGVHAHRGAADRARHRPDARRPAPRRRGRAADGARAPPPAPPRATTYKLCSLLLQYPDDELLAAPRRARAPRSPSSRARRPPTALERFLRLVDAADPLGARAALRRDVRPAQALRALPDLLRRGRPARARRGAAAAASSSTAPPACRWRAPSCPTTCR